MSRAGVRAGGLPCHVVPGPGGTWGLRRRPVRVHVVSRGGIDAAGLPRLVLPAPGETLTR